MFNSAEEKDSSGTQILLAEFEKLDELRLEHERMLVKFETEGVPIENIRLLKDGFLSIRIGMVYYAEANRCVQAQAWFAATTVGVAALEAILLAQCLMQAEKVKALEKFRALKLGKNRDFSHFARQLDLGKLLEIADKLKWFPEGAFPVRLRTLMGRHLSDEELRVLLEPFEGRTDIGEICAQELKEVRNLIHPAVCLKQDRTPSAAIGMSGTFLLMTLLSLLSD